MPIVDTRLTSVIWLLLLLLLAVGYGLVQIGRSKYSLWEIFLYIPVMLIGRFWWRVHFSNEPPPEIDAGALLVANHRSSVDPFFVQLAARRRVHWMVAREFCEHAVFGRILRPFEVIPTNRSGMDTGSTKIAMRLTKEGRMVGMFPEGRINQSSETLLPLRAGAALIAMRSQVPIIPLLIEGSPYCKTVWSPLLMPAHVRITFGRPLAPQDFQQTEPAQLEDDLNSEHSPADAMILSWGKQILELARCRGQTAELASARRSKNPNSVSVTPAAS